MDSSSSIRKQAQPTLRKGKKKQVKDEFDRIKQAEKKKRRLEKAIATSAAIRAELEKKKQRKKEGQQEAADEVEVEENSADAAKKKQEKDEPDRIKQAEKKNILLEKSLATSAAIRAELEKKKLKKLEEQRRLDEEGAAIAEAVALHVLLDEEDYDDSYRIMLNQETGLKPWDYTAKSNLFTGGRNTFFPHQRCLSYAVHSNRPRDSNWSSVSYDPFARRWDNNMRISADLIAAQAVSSLQISEDADVDAVFFNGMFRR